MQFWEDRTMTMNLLLTKFDCCHHHLLQHVRHAVHLVLLDLFVHHIMTYFGPHDFVGVSAITANYVRHHQGWWWPIIRKTQHPWYVHSNPENFLKSTRISKILTAKHNYTSRGIFLQFMMMVTMTTFSVTFINLSMVPYTLSFTFLTI